VDECKPLLAGYKKQLGDDPIIAAHLGELKDSLMEQNIVRIIEPFSQAG
jgi:26S proteasome regulatory subunit N6